MFLIHKAQYISQYTIITIVIAHMCHRNWRMHGYNMRTCICICYYTPASAISSLQAPCPRAYDLGLGACKLDIARAGVL